MNQPAVSSPQALHIQISTGGKQAVDLFIDGHISDFNLGRGSTTCVEDGRIYLRDEYVSRYHCRLFWDGDQGWLLEDLQSANGTRINGMPLLGAVDVLDGITIKLGTSTVAIKPNTNSRIAVLSRGSTQHDQADLSTDSTLVQDETVLLDGTEMMSDRDFTETTIETGHTDVTEIGLGTAEALSQKKQPLAEERPSEVPPLGILHELFHAGLLQNNEIKALIESTHSTGVTLFRSLVESRSTRFLEGILSWVAKNKGLEYIDHDEALYEQTDRVSWLNWDQAERLGIIVLKSDHDEIIRYGAIDPFDLMTRDWLNRTKSGLKDPVLVHPVALHSVLDRIKSQSVIDEEELGVAIDFSPEQEANVREHVETIDVPRIVNYFLHRAAIQGASDIHVEPGEIELDVRLRVDGILYEDMRLPMAYHREISSRLKIMSGMNVAERRRPQDGRISVVIRGKPIDVRCSTYPTVHGEKMVLRLLDKSALRPSPETLGLLDRDLLLVKEKIQAPYGLIMVSGPTGSGKTTTLYSCLGSIDKTTQNILTVEDPVEYQIPGVHQMQINPKIGLTFASGLKTMLRQDPDVIMVGESRDAETAQMSIQAALTGHVVFSTIHTNDAVGVITRLLDMKIEPFLVASALFLSMAQRLVRTICPHCKESVTGETIIAKLEKDGISAQRLEKLDVDIDPDMDYAEGRGCAHCRDTGYMGRRAVFEVFEITRDVRSLITSADFTESKLHDMARESGMTTLLSHGLTLIDDEITTFEEVIRVLGETQ